MEITITVNHGPIDAEFTGDDREELQTELTQFIDYLEDNDDALSNLSPNNHANGQKDDGVQTPATEWDDSDTSTNSETSGSEKPEFTSLSTKTGVSTGTLSKLYELPDDEEGTPSLNMYHFEDGVLTLGQHRNQRQAQASTLLLYAWEECLDQKRVEYEKLDAALVASDVETERRDAMGQAYSDDAQEWFESDGSSIYLVGKGKNHARELIQDLDEQLDG